MACIVTLFSVCPQAQSQDINGVLQFLVSLFRNHKVICNSRYCFVGYDSFTVIKPFTLVHAKGIVTSVEVVRFEYQ